MRRITLIILLALFLPIVSFAHSAIYLKNGNVVRGEIIEKKANGTVTVATLDGKELTYSQFDIREIKEEYEIPQQKNNGKYVAYGDKTDGRYYFAAEFGVLATLDHKGETMFPMQLGTVHGFRLNEYLGIGGGIGIRYYGKNEAIRNYKSPWDFPLFLDLRGVFVSHRSRMIVPYWSLNAGVLLKEQKFYLEPTVGITIGDYRHNVNIGLTYMNLNLDSNKDNNKVLNHNALGLKVGYQF